MAQKYLTEAHSRIKRVKDSIRVSEMECSQSLINYEKQNLES
jgi:hypothetical protein